MFLVGLKLAHQRPPLAFSEFELQFCRAWSKI